MSDIDEQIERARSHLDGMKNWVWSAKQELRAAKEERKSAQELLTHLREQRRAAITEAEKGER